MSRIKRALNRNEHIKQLNDGGFDCFQLHNSTKPSNMGEKETQKITLREFIKEICLILTDKAETNGSLTSSAFALLVSITFRAVALAGFLVFGAGLYATVQYGVKLYGQGNLFAFENIFALIMVLLILFIVGMYAIIMWGASNEMRKEKDKNYIVAVFSGVVSFVALIVAFVALIKG